MTITHPCHPLRGQRVEIVRVRRGPDPDLIVRLPDGQHIAVAMSWTDYASLPDLDDSPPLSNHLLDFGGLLQVVRFIEDLPRSGGDPAAGPASQTDNSMVSVEARHLPPGSILDGHLGGGA